MTGYENRDRRQFGSTDRSSTPKLRGGVKCTMVVSHASAYPFRALASVWSAVRPQRSFVALDSPTYRQCALGSGGTLPVGYRTGS